MERVCSEAVQAVRTADVLGEEASVVIFDEVRISVHPVIASSATGA